MHSKLGSRKLASSVRIRAPVPVPLPYTCLDVMTTEILPPVCRVQRVYNDAFCVFLVVISYNVKPSKHALINASNRPLSIIYVPVCASVCAGVHARVCVMHSCQRGLQGFRDVCILQHDTTISLFRTQVFADAYTMP